MNKKNYLWIAIAVMVVIVALLLLVKGQGTDLNKTAPVADNTNGIINNETASTEPAVVGKPNEQSVTDTLPLAKEAVIEVNGKTMTPKTIRVKAGEKVFMTFSAKDDARHTFNFIDADLSFILVVFNKAEGNKSVTFPAPAAGTYTYYVDDKANTGKLIIE